MRNVIVTGASRGLGLAIAKTLARSEIRVIAVSRNQTDALISACSAAEIETAGAIVFRPYDLTDIEGIRSLVKSFRAEFGPIYGLVNNAGIGTPGILATMTDASIVAMLDLNLRAPLTLTKYALTSMLSQRAGRIVNISSIVGSSGYRGLSVYSATKAALNGFTRSLAREVGSVGVTVNSVAPGFIDTDLTAGMEELAREKIVRRSAMRRLVDVDDVAETVDYLISEKAKNITGTVVTVDAGNTA